MQSAMHGSWPEAWTPFAEPSPAPGGMLQRYHTPDGSIGMSISYRVDLADHPMLRPAELEPILQVLREPSAPGVLPLLHWEEHTARFAYDIGDGRLLAEILAELRDRGMSTGARAAMELLAGVAGLLDGAAHMGLGVGLLNHGNLNPWRIIVYPQGEVALLGYALPPLEVADWLDGETDELPGEGLRFSPPERVQDGSQEEDVRSDLYAIAVIVEEMLLDRRVLEGPASDVVQEILGEGPSAQLDELQRPLRSILEPLLRAGRGDRPGSATQVSQSAAALLPTLSGPTLSEVWRGVRAVEPEGLDNDMDTEPDFELDLQVEDVAVTNQTAELDFEGLGHHVRGLGAPLGPQVPGEVESSSQLSLGPDGPRLARAVWPDAPEKLFLRAAKIDFDLEMVFRDDGRAISLGTVPAAVLAYLASQREREIDTATIWRKVSDHHASRDTIEGIIERLREKIEVDPEEPDHLIDGIEGGYRLVRWEGSTARVLSLPASEGEVPGRASEQEELVQLLLRDDSVLVSVVGPPGSGASQLALNAAWRLQAEGWEVHRAVIGGSSNPVATLAQALGIRSLGRAIEPVVDDIGKVLAKRHDLLILLDVPRPHPGARDLVLRWLDQQPQALILVSGRGRLGLGEVERVLPLGPLGREDATALFQRQVRESRPGTEVAPEVARAIADALDRMPLALQRAAQRTRAVAPERLLAQINEGLDLELTEGGMQANLETALDELEPVARLVLRQCSLFGDSFDLDAAQSVVEIPEGNNRDLLSTLEGLAARSLIRDVDPSSATGAWALYESVRKHLRRTVPADALTEARERHARYFGQLGLKLGAGPWVEQRARRALSSVRSDLAAVMRGGGLYSAGAGLGLSAILEPETVDELATALQRMLQDPALTDRGLVKAKKGQDEGEEARKWYVAARLAAARLDLYLGQLDRAEERLNEASHEVMATHVMMLLDLAWMFVELDSVVEEGPALFEAKSALHRVGSADPWVLAVSALLGGRIALSDGELKAAERLITEALNGFGPPLRAQVGAAQAQRHHADVLIARGQTDRAVAQLQAAHQVFVEVGDVLNATRCRVRAAELRVAVGNLPEALTELEAVVAAAADASTHGLIATARGLIGVIRTIRLLADWREREREPTAEDWAPAEQAFFLALAGASEDHRRIQAWFSLHLLLRGDVKTAREEAGAASQDSIATALLAVVERRNPPREPESYRLYDALEAWRGFVPLERLRLELEKRPSLPVRMVLAAPYPQPAPRS